MSEKDEVLHNVHKALTGDPNRATLPGDLNLLPPLGRVLPPIECSDLVPKFEQELGNVAVSAHRVQAKDELRDLLSRTLEHDRASGAVLSRNPLLGRLGLASILNELGIPFWPWTPGATDTAASPAGPSYRDHCFSAAAGITGVDFALAESGSLVVSSATEGAQLSSLAPPIHIAFYLRSQVVETLEEVLQGLKPSAGGPAIDGRSIVLITGTSRTADIEQILIRGVHGPREVHAVLVENSYFAVAQ